MAKNKDKQKPKQNKSSPDMQSSTFVDDNAKSGQSQQSQGKAQKGGGKGGYTG